MKLYQWALAGWIGGIFLLGLTNHFEHFGLYEVVVLAVMGGFISAIVYHASRQ